MSNLLTLSIILKIVAIGSALGLAFVVLLQSRRRLNLLFGGWMGTVVLWSLSSLMLQLAPLPGLEAPLSLWLAMSQVGLFAMPLALYLLALRLCNQLFHRYAIGAAALGGGGLLVALIGIVVDRLGVRLFFLGDGRLNYQLDYTHPILLVSVFYGVLYFALSEGVLILATLRAVEQAGTWRTPRLLVGIGGGLVGLGCLSQAVPTVGQHPWDAVGVILGTFVIGYVILHEQLFEPFRELNRTLALTNERLEAAYREATKADQLKSEFVARMSHELRTPLHTIIGFTQVILRGIDGPLTDRQRTDLSAIYSSSQHLLGLVNDILDLSKIEAGKMDLEPERLSLNEVLLGVMPAALALVGDKPIELREEIAANLPPVFVDRRRIRQVVFNLISNAAKFTDAGSITLRVERQGNDHLLCCVEDTGIGIPPGQLDKVFEEFYQANNRDARRAEGSGLGLAISRRLVELHGGRMWVESQVGQGSAFYFTLPL